MMLDQKMAQDQIEKQKAEEQLIERFLEQTDKEEKTSRNIWNLQQADNIIYRNKVLLQSKYEKKKIVITKDELKQKEEERRKFNEIREKVRK